jgi:SWI/SNF-related matrix-associated actin-dependent regulator of chromatin subfamily D
MYQALLDMERQLDWTMTRKKAEIQDALGRPPTVRRVPRVRVGADSAHAVRRRCARSASSSRTPSPASSGRRVMAAATWTWNLVRASLRGSSRSKGACWRYVAPPCSSARLTGRMVQLPNQRAKDRPTARKLSTFIHRIFVELERDPALHPDGNTAEVTLHVRPGVL